MTIMIIKIIIITAKNLYDIYLLYKDLPTEGFSNAFLPQLLWVLVLLPHYIKDIQNNNDK